MPGGLDPTDKFSLDDALAPILLASFLKPSTYYPL